MQKNKKSDLKRKILSEKNISFIFVFLVVLISIAFLYSIYKPAEKKSEIMKSSNTKRCNISEYTWVTVEENENCDQAIEGYKNKKVKSETNSTSEPVVNKVNSNITNTNTNFPDDPVHCNVNSKCGGGTTPLKRWECEESICCEVNSGKWELVIGNSKCDSIQGNNGESSGSTYGSPSNTNTSTNSEKKLAFNATETSIKGTYYCYESKVNSMTTQQSFVKTVRETYEICNGSSYNESVYNSCANENTCFDRTGSEQESCYASCYDEAYGDCRDYYSKYLDERSNLDRMRWDFCP